jgi:hypothetical protein
MSVSSDEVSLWLPGLLVSIAVGRALVARGVLSKDDVLKELNRPQGETDDPLLIKARDDSVTIVSNW